MTRAKIVAFAIAVVVAILVAFVLRYSHPAGETQSSGTFEEAASHRGRIGVFGDAPVGVVGTRFETIRDDSPLGAALASADPSVGRRAFDAARLHALVIDVARARLAPASSCLGRLGRFESVEGFRTIALETGRILVEPFDLPVLSDEEKAALPRVARQILAGGTPPRLSQFPAHLRAPVTVEVLLALRQQNGELSLWRSARASSIASGLLTATRVAMERWNAREENLGGSLGAALHNVDVEVALLVDDGTIVTRADGFIDQVIGPTYGVAFDQPSSWHYLLPESPERRRAGSGSAAFRALFVDRRGRPDGISDRSIRLYRVRVLTLGVDRARL